MGPSKNCVNCGGTPFAEIRCEMNVALGEKRSAVTEDPLHLIERNPALNHP